MMTATTLMEIEEEVTGRWEEGERIHPCRREFCRPTWSETERACVCALVVEIMPLVRTHSLSLYFKRAIVSREA